MKLTNTQIECMIEDLSSEIIRILMEEWQYNMTQAMEVYYNSDTFERLSDPTTGLYYQSAGYVYDFLKKELTTGQVSSNRVSHLLVSIPYLSQVKKLPLSNLCFLQP